MVLNGTGIKLNRLTAAVGAMTTAAAFGLAVPAVAQNALIQVDGSSTVFPISEAVAEEFMAENQGVNVAVGVSGTGGGFRKFCAGETDISNASRPIRASEMQACMEAGIEYIEIPVAYDAITVVINPENTWAREMTVDELKRMWEPSAEGSVTRWSQVNPAWPDAPIDLFGPGSDSGTFDYFTEEIVGETAASRGDYTASEDDNILVVGVQRDVNALGYFGYSYYIENADSLDAVAVDAGDGPVAPSAQTVNNGTYTPLSRPIFIYVNRAAADRPEIRAFVQYHLDQAETIVPEVGYVTLSDEAYDLGRQLLSNRVVGTVYHSNETSGLELEAVIGLTRVLEPMPE